MCSAANVGRILHKWDWQGLKPRLDNQLVEFIERKIAHPKFTSSSGYRVPLRRVEFAGEGPREEELRLRTKARMMLILTWMARGSATRQHNHALFGEGRGSSSPELAAA